jgi:predicted nucleic acid-binding protein
LLDTSPLTAYLSGRIGAVQVIDQLRAEAAVQTSLLVYGEIFEYFRGTRSFERRYRELRSLTLVVRPLTITRSIVERYATLRREMRPPRGPGLVGDIDTLIAATAIGRGITLVTTDSDFDRVPGLRSVLLERWSFERVRST